MDISQLFLINVIWCIFHEIYFLIPKC